MSSINTFNKAIAACALSGALLSGCTGGAAQIPSANQANLNANVLQFRVGTARFGADGGVVGLNAVATLRQPNGNTGVLATQPTLTGPAGFLVPPGAPGAYGGTNTDANTPHIGGSPQVPLNNAGLVNTTLGTFTGVFSYGFGPYNCDQNCTNIGAYFPGNPNNSGGNGFTSSNYACSSFVCLNSGTPGDVGQVQPYFGTGFDFLVGPPAVPFFNNGTFPTGFAGYSPGFTAFELTPVSGQYTLSVLAAARNAPQVTYTGTATLNAATVLGAITVNSTKAGAPAGGLTGIAGVPAGVTETEVYVVVVKSSGTQYFYTVGPLAGTGALAWTLPGNLGPCNGSNCQSGAGATATLATSDTYFVAAVGFDYPAFEAGPPGNTQQTPVLTGGAGQTDLTISSYDGPHTY